MTDIKNEEAGEKKSLNFIEQAVEKDLKEGKNGGKVQTRFPPEPNGYLHIGHAKAICLDFGIAEKHGGVCNLRFDDTNPTKEDVEYVEAIKEDIQWLGYQWGNEYYASDYFQQLWDFAIRLIQEGKAYIDEQSSELIAQQKGTPTQPGVESPYRNRPIEESLELFKKMNSGEIEEGAMVLRAKIDMANPNMHFRDPIIYRVVKHPHHRTGTTWKAYPMYDFAHGQSDFFEGVTHSLCTLEFVVHRPLYDLFIDWLKEGKDLNDNRPRQTEFNKLNLSYTLMSKRNLLTLVKEGLVNGWDDPRMPTICGFRRRGYSPESIHKFIDKIGYTTYDALNDIALLESSVRDDLNSRATRVSAVINPVKLIITNYPEGQVEELEAINNPEDPEAGSHLIEFSRELWMEREDFMEDAPKKYFRMTPGQEVRLKNAYIVKCTGCKKDENGVITEVYTSGDYGFVKKIAQQSETGPATTVISGIAVGMQSTAVPIILIAIGIIGAYSFSGLYGIALAAVGMLSTTGITVAVDAYGPIADNAGGIAEMSGLPSEVRNITDKLDAVGNTTAAMGKGFAIGSAALTALALFVSYAQAVGLFESGINLLDYKVIVGMFVGGMLPFLFSAFTMDSVSKAAYKMIEEVRRQFKTIPGILEGKGKPDYTSCVAISTQAALKEMLLPGVMAVLAPLFIGVVLGPAALGGLLGGALVTGVMLAIFMSNSGGAWDNAKKYIEDGNHGGKGSEAHRAAVVGDTVGDPFKDTSGPSINILIKLMTIVSLVFAPLFLSIGGLF